MGEAKFVRAFAYFYLINLFGDVPLETSTGYVTNSILPRTQTGVVYQQILSDLQSAENSMSDSYPSTDKARANKWAAVAMLARVYLYTGKWAAAEASATDVINSGTYTLESNLNNVFLVTSNEAIWQMQPTTTYFNTAEGLYFLPAASYLSPSYRLQSFLLNSFESGDQRFVNWTIAYGPNIVPYKFKIRTSTTLIEYETPLRLAEQYLIRAEARAQQNNLSGTIADLNVIRNRAALPNTAASDKSTLLTAIYHENQIEFFAEWGHRWMDLKRTGLIDQILGSEKTGWQSYQALYPIPVSQITVNPQLTMGKFCLHRVSRSWGRPGNVL
jgi:hypothetical protein